MKLIIAGSRSIIHHSITMYHIQGICYLKDWVLTEIVSGMAAGPDIAGVLYGKKYNIPVKCMYADWVQYKKAAGPIRNKEMAEYADALIAFWDGESKGTADMIRQAYEKELDIVVYICANICDGQYYIANDAKVEELLCKI